MIRSSQIWDIRKEMDSMINKNMLLGKMALNGYSQVQLAHVIGMSRNTMNAKINGKRPFNTDEVIEICKVLQITSDNEKLEIFLPYAS